MKKAKLNLIIDAIMLVIMMALIGVGLLNKYVLLTGQEKWEKYGENLEFYLWGFDRHDWNYIHFILGIILFGLLVLHILFHWKMILNIYRNLIKNKKTRIFTGYTLVFISIILLIFPIFVKPEIDEAITRGGRHFSEIAERNKEYKEMGRERRDGKGEGSRLKNTEPLPIEKEENGSANKSLDSDKNEIKPEKDQVHFTNQNDGSDGDRHRDIPSNIDIVGSMTLLEVAEKYNVPVNHIKNKLDVPLSTSNNERLGRLKRTYGFTMSDVEEIVYNYQQAKK